VTNKVISLVAVIKFLSDFRAKTDRRSNTYRSRYWLARGMDAISRLYVATISSVFRGCFAITANFRTEKTDAEPSHTQCVSKLMDGCQRETLAEEYQM
jgi:hypothetical protein